MSYNYEDYLAPIIVTEFERENVFRFQKQILQETLVDTVSPIVVFIDSMGGCVEGMASMIEIMKSVPNPIHTVCRGRAYSAGAFFLSFGDKRYCGPNSRVMIHKLSSAALGHLDDLKNSTEELVKVNDFWFQRLAENCKTIKEEIELQLRAIEGRELWLNADEALAFGIVDEVGMPPVKLKRKTGKRNVRRKKTKQKTKGGR